MRVLMFGWEFPPHIAGGLGTACYGLTRALAAQGVDVIFVVPKAYGDEDKRYIELVNASDVEASYSSLFFGSSASSASSDSFSSVSIDKSILEHLSFIHIDSNLVPYLAPEEYDSLREQSEIRHARYSGVEHAREAKGGDVWSERYNFSGKYGATLMEEVARYAVVAAEVAERLAGQFDVIHAHDWLTYYAGIAAREVSGKPLVVHMHATEFDRSGVNVNKVVYNIERGGMSAADRVVAVSNLTRDTVIEKYGIAADRVVTVHNGVMFKAPVSSASLSSTTSSEVTLASGRSVMAEDKIVTFLGRITFQKGPDYFVEAAAKVLARVPNVRFVMAGSGDMFNHVVRRVARLGIADRFHFTGFLKGDDVHKMFEMSDVYIMPSVSEPFGISPLEAMRSNVPVIISKQSGVAEVLTYAVKVDYWDVDAMADAIYALLQYPALSKMFIEHGLREVDGLKWDGAAIKLKGIYQELIDSSH